MLTDKLREGAHGKVFKILFWMIILSFIFAGVGNYLIPRMDTSPARVGDYSISDAAWNENYNQRTRAMMAAQGSQAVKLLENKDFVQMLRMQVLESLIDGVALNSAAWDAGVRIGDDEVKAEIRSLPYFQKDGKFDNDLYLATVRNSGNSPDSFAEHLRVEMLARTILDPVADVSALALPYEISQLGDIFAQTRIVDLYTPDLAAIREGMSVGDEEAKQYYDAHHEAFTIPASTAFNYVLLSVAELKGTVKPEPAQIEEYYNHHQDEFTRPEQRDASHILIKKGEGAEAKIAEVQKALNDGADFAELAGRYSDDGNTAGKGGELGPLGRNDLSAPLSAALYGLAAPGNVSGPVEDEGGTHFIRYNSKIEAHVPPLAEIMDEAREKFIDAEAKRLYTEKVSTLTDVSYENPDSLDATAKALDLPVRDAGAVTLGDAQKPWPLSEREVQDAAFAEQTRSSGSNSPVVGLGDDAALVLNVYKYTEAKLEDFDSVKSKAAQLALDAKAASEAEKILSDYQRRLKEDAAAPLPPHVLQKAGQTVRRDSGASEYGADFMFAVYALPAEPERASVITGGTQPHLVVLREIKPDPDNDIKAYQNLLTAQLTRYKAERAQQNLYQNARQLSHVEYNQEAIKLSMTQNAQTE